MFRLAIFALLISTGPVLAQVGEFSGVVNPFVSAQPGTQHGVAPVAPMPAPPASLSDPSRSVITPHGRNVLVPGGLSGQNSFQDRAGRCIQAGTAAGLGSNAIGAFTLQCAN